jgi:predicted kinase
VVACWICRIFDAQHNYRESVVAPSGAKVVEVYGYFSESGYGDEVSHATTTRILWLIRGLPGSGKSTRARALGIPDHYEADMWFEKNGVYAFDPSKLSEAHAWCKARALETMRAGRPVVVSNTFVKLWEMEFYKKAAADHGYSVVEETMQGNYGSMHGVPQDVIERMRGNFEASRTTIDFDSGLVWEKEDA